MKKDKKEEKASLGFSIVVIMVSLVLIVTSFIQESSSEKDKEDFKEEIVKEIVKEVILKKPSCPDTTDAFYKLKNSGQIVTLAENLNSYGENGYFVNKKFTVVKSTGSGSQIACGYLYVKAHTRENKPLQFKWEHPYIKPGQFGGHIETGNSIIPSTNNEGTELLFNLSKINYRIKNNDSETRKADWAALLNVSDETQFDIALNTIDKTGILDEVSIAYQCWSPETGEITRDCKLMVE